MRIIEKAVILHILTALLLLFLTHHTTSIQAAARANYNQIYEKFKSEDIDILHRKGEDYYQKNETDSALVCFSIIVNSYTPTQDRHANYIYASSLNRSGIIHVRYNDYTKGLNLFVKALQVVENTGDDVLAGKIYNNMAHVYYIFRDYKTAIEYCEKALAISQKYNDNETQYIVLTNMIGIYNDLKDVKSLETFIDRFRQINIPDTNYRNYYMTIGSALLHEHKKEYSEAVALFKKSIQYAAQNKDPESLQYYSLAKTAKTFTALNQNDSALCYWNKAREIAEENDYLNMQAECYEYISKLYFRTGAENTGRQYRQKYLHITDSIFNMQEFNKIKEVKFLHELSEIEKEVSRLNNIKLQREEQLKKQRIITYVGLGISVTICAFLFILYKKNKRLEEANKELFNRNLEILQADEQQKAIRKQQYSEMMMRNDAVAPAPPAAPEEDTAEKADTEAETKEQTTETKTKYQNSNISEKDKEMLKSAIQDIMDNTLEYCQTDFSLDKMATLVNSKSKYVSQVINESFGKNFNTYINEYRIKEACRRLIDPEKYGNYTIASIAGEMGFKSSANFNSIFKKITGMTPTVYQKMARQSAKNTAEEATEDQGEE